MEDSDLAQMATSIVVAMIEARLIHAAADVLTTIDEVKERLAGEPQPKPPEMPIDIPEGLENVM